MYLSSVGTTKLKIFLINWKFIDLNNYEKHSVETTCNSSASEKIPSWHMCVFALMMFLIKN